MEALLKSSYCKCKLLPCNHLSLSLTEPNKTPATRHSRHPASTSQQRLINTVAAQRGWTVLKLREERENNMEGTKQSLGNRQYGGNRPSRVHCEILICKRGTYLESEL